jgi:predicted dehydrogenase
VASARRLADSVSTRPASSSYVWGGRTSLFSYTVFHGFYLLRLLSPLQWIKLTVRQRTSKRATTNLRPDVPASYTELYFLGVLAVAAAAYLATSGHPVQGVLGAAGTAMGCLLIVETLVWIVYYLLLRGFVEGRFTIFHPAEYLLTLPVVIAAQLLLTAAVTGRPLRALAAAMTGNPPDDRFLYLAFASLGLLYFGAAISVLLTSHPGIVTRPAQTVAIIGAGDVTTQRIVPALAELGYRRADIFVVTVAGSDPPDALRRRARVLEAEEAAVLRHVLREQAPTIIATPTFAHFEQIVALAGAGLPFAVEKPIAGAWAERDHLRRSKDTLMANGFALSYYVLEKALPLTYLLNPLPVFEQFLEFDATLDRRRLREANIALGELKSVKVDLLEDKIRSPTGSQRLWTETPDTLRPFIDTTIHPLLIARLATGTEPITWAACALGRHAPREKEVWDEHAMHIAPTWLDATANAGAVAIELCVAKYAPKNRREAVLKFANGEIQCDFDTRAASVNAGAALRGSIRVRAGSDYAVLMSLFVKFSLSGWGPIRFDDFERQLDALDAWDALCDAVEREGVPVVDYDDELPSVARRTL